MYPQKFTPGWRSATIVMTTLAILATLSSKTALAHGVIGDRIFLSPIVGNDAFPDNAFSLTARRSDYEFSLMPELEKQLSDYSSVLINGAWDELEPEHQADQSGATDVTLYFRQAAYISVPHEFELTLSPFVVLPTGDQQIGDQGYTHLGGEVLMAKGLGDLPQQSVLRYLRPLAFQAETGYAGRVEGPANSDVFANLEIEYSLLYLGRFVQRADIVTPWMNIIPYVQINYAQTMIDSRLTTLPDFRLTPGIAYMGEYCELSIGTQVALNGAAQNDDRVAVIGLVEIFYDNIFPALAWNPF